MSTDVTTYANEGFLTYEDPDNYEMFWAKRFLDTVSTSQAVGIIDCSIRLPTEFVYAAINFPPIVV